MFRILLTITILLIFNHSNAQQKNYIKLHWGDCINCVNTISTIIKKDPNVIFIAHEDYKSDSSELFEKFSLKSYSRQFIWSSPLYDSFSKQLESEFIQTYDGQIFNRSALRNLNFKTLRLESNNNSQIELLPNSSASKNSNHTDLLPDHLEYRDYKKHTLLDAYISKKKFIFFKDLGEIREVKIDSNWLKRIYFEYLKDTGMYYTYMADIKTMASIKPKITSLCPFDDSTVIAVLRTYVTDIEGTDTSYKSLITLVQYRKSGKHEMIFVNNKIPTPFHYMNEMVLYSNKKFYIPVVFGANNLPIEKNDFRNMVQLKKEKNVLQFEKYLPSELNKYLIDNKVFHNCNLYFIDNGYFLMSLSDHLLDLETGDKIALPFGRDLFNGIKLGGQLSCTQYNIWDFKYNPKEKKFYLLYYNDNKYYVASFKKGAASFETNELLYTFDSQLGKSIKSICFSWDAKSITYQFKGDNTFKYSTIADLQNLAKTYSSEQNKTK
ncbi:MAG: hypothetical protein V4561_04555 [Bacteroidota bacterium]